MLVCTLTHIAYDLLPIKFKIIYIYVLHHTHTHSSTDMLYHIESIYLCAGPIYAAATIDSCVFHYPNPNAAASSKLNQQPFRVNYHSEQFINYVFV